MESLAKELTCINLPYPSWCLHIHPKHEFIAILHIRVTSTKFIVDKCLLLAEEKCGIKAKVFLNGYLTHLSSPIFNSTMRTVADVTAVVHTLHSKNVCLNAIASMKYPMCLKVFERIGDGVSEENSEYCCLCRDKSDLEVVPEVLTFKVSEQDNVSNLREQNIIPDQTKPGQVCLICDKKFFLEADLVVHNKQHNLCKTGEGTVSKCNEGESNKVKQSKGLCNVCGKIFTPTSRLEEHMLTHTQEKPFQCKVCNKGFAKSFNLRMHEHTHSGARPYVCSACGKSYTTSSNLRSHVISCHSKMKKHFCEICNMGFVYPRYLKLHMRTHTGERPFMCTTCGKKFSKNIHLTVHFRTHTGEKPHRCNICGKSFTTTGGLGYHKKAHHKDIDS